MPRGPASARAGHRHNPAGRLVLTGATARVVGQAARAYPVPAPKGTDMLNLTMIIGCTPAPAAIRLSAASAEGTR